MPEGAFENTVDYFPDELSGEVKVQAKLDHHTTMLGGVVRIGRIVAATAEDPAEPGDIPRVLVQIGGSDKGSYIRNWMPWTTTRAGYDGEWWAPDLDEQVLVIAPSGNLTQGVIVGVLFRGALTFDSDAGAIKVRDALPGVSETEKQLHKRIYKDGSSFVYDHNLHQFSVKLQSAPNATESIRFSSVMEPDGSKKGTGTTSLQVGSEAQPDIAIKLDSSGSKGGELNLECSLKTTLNAGKKTSAVITADESIVLNAGTTKITINQDGAVDISTAGKAITLTGDVKVKGTMDVS